MFLIEEFKKNIPDSIKTALSLCSDAAGEQNLPIFLIGGIVRDIVTKNKNFDVDITVQGNAIKFAETLQERYPQVCILKETHEDFKTAKVLCKIAGEVVNLDIASTRKESYPYPASLPVLEETGCDLYEDVSRRDFSINSMALSLNKDSFCELIDYLNGYEDLRQRKIKVFHPLSFIDDPTRIIRALKFRVRFDYELEENTQNLMNECLASGRFDDLAGKRIKLELKQTFNINRAECLEKFIREKIYRLISSKMQIPEKIDSLALRCQAVVGEYEKYLKTSDTIWLVYLGLLFADSSEEIISDLVQKLYLSGNEEAVLQGARLLCENKAALNNNSTRFEVYEFFEKADIESILVFLIKNQSLKNQADLFLEELKDITISSDGNVLIKMGLTPGPVFGEALREVLKAKINKLITSPEDELEFIKKLLF